MNEILDKSIINIKGVGEKTLKLLNEMGVYTVRDILSFFPRTYIHYENIVDKIEDINLSSYNAILGTIRKEISILRYSNYLVAKGYIDTPSFRIEVIFYRMPYIKRVIKLNIPYVFYGRVRKTSSGYRLEHPKMFALDEYYNMLKSPFPLYRIKKGLSSKKISTIVKNALLLTSNIEDTFPKWLIEKRGLPSLDFSIRHMHFPTNDDDINISRSRFVYEELLKFSLEQEKYIESKDKVPNNFSIKKFNLYKKILDNLNFNLTKDQENAVKDIFNDFKKDIVTERLIQGDVGSGKTIVSILSMVTMAENNYQSLMMVPTGVLAFQHYNYIKDLLKKCDININVSLLTGNTKQSEKKEILKNLKNGTIDIVIGTHALIEDKVLFKNLALSITDEQHRFGVRQRDTLLRGENKPFSILLSATPIPRTLSLILYHGMNISRILTVPSDRKKIKTAVISEKDRYKAWKLILKEVREKRQAYIVCPLVSKSDTFDKENVLDYEEMLKEALGEQVRISILHGKMKGIEKEYILNSFLNKEIDILISTTVVEVGVNVVDATVMMIENADSFGLSTLHQLRGRVGRASHQSYCILVNSASSKNLNANKRLMAIRDSTDGFYIAEMDLKLRGSGDLNGIRQSGEAFNISDIYRDFDIIKDASEDAKKILSEDKDLSLKENLYFKQMLEKDERKFYTNL